jgi:hypothetical protein
MLRLASFGCEGVNMETDINQLGFISHYSPIVHDEAGHCNARPEYYGMLAFSLAAKGEMVGLTLDATNLAISAYATKESSGLLWITAVNKDFSNGVLMRIDLPEGYGRVDVFRLVAPSIESKDQVTLAEREVRADGAWNPGPPERCAVQDGIAVLELPCASAAVLRVQRVKSAGSVNTPNGNQLPTR